MISTFTMDGTPLSPQSDPGLDTWSITLASNNLKQATFECFESER